MCGAKGSKDRILWHRDQSYARVSDQWGPQERWPHSRKKLLVKASETPCSCWIIRAGHFGGDIPYTYKVLLRVAQSCERSELPWVEVPLPAYAASVVAKTFPVGNNPFRGTGWLEQP